MALLFLLTSSTVYNSGLGQGSSPAVQVAKRVAGPRMRWQSPPAWQGSPLWAPSIAALFASSHLESIFCVISDDLTESSIPRKYSSGIISRGRTFNGVTWSRCLPRDWPRETHKTHPLCFLIGP